MITNIHLIKLSQNLKFKLIFLMILQSQILFLILHHQNHYPSLKLIFYIIKPFQLIFVNNFLKFFKDLYYQFKVLHKNLIHLLKLIIFTLNLRSFIIFSLVIPFFIPRSFYFINFKINFALEIIKNFNIKLNNYNLILNKI